MASQELLPTRAPPEKTEWLLPDTNRTWPHPGWTPDRMALVATAAANASDPATNQTYASAFVLVTGLVALVLGILAVMIFDLDAKGVRIASAVPTGLPTPGLPDISLSDLPCLITGAVSIVFLAEGESLGAARASAAKNRHEIAADQELIARDAANLSAGLFQGFTVDATASHLSPPSTKPAPARSFPPIVTPS